MHLVLPGNEGLERKCKRDEEEAISGFAIKYFIHFAGKLH